jgi:putative membrane protein
MNSDGVDEGRRTPGQTVPARIAADAVKGLGRVSVGLKAAVGIVGDVEEMPGAHAADAGTRLAVERTELALERSFLAHERTLMAWIRTALSMISFGFTIGKLGQAMKSVEVRKLLGDGQTSVSVQSLAYFLVVLGTAVMIGGAIQFRVRTNGLKRQGLATQWSMTIYVAILLAIVGGGALSALVLEL